MNEAAEKATGIAMADAELADALRMWFDNDRKWCGGDAPFGKWLLAVAESAGEAVGRDATPDDVVAALRVNATGDGFAKSLKDESVGRGFEAEAYSYVGEGVVHSNVFLNGGDEDSVKAEAEAIAARFREAGYAAEAVCEHPDNDTVFGGSTVFASIDFALYRGK